jgi:hypothetical protein
MPSIEVSDATMAKVRYEADRRGITVEMMTKVFVQFAINEANAQIAAMSTVERPDPSPEFVALAMEHGQKLMADLHELERAGWPPGTR